MFGRNRFRCILRAAVALDNILYFVELALTEKLSALANFTSRYRFLHKTDDAARD